MLLRIRKALLVCDIADTEMTRSQGLRSRYVLRASEGMLFAFETKQSLVEMTMAGVRFPLDMMFIDHRNRVKKIEHDVLPETDSVSCTGVSSVIEAPAGFCKRHRISIGDTVAHLTT